MEDAPIIVRTRTGKKLHLGYPDSSCTNCGTWLRVNGHAMRFPTLHVVAALERGEAVRNPSALGPATLILCERCFGPEQRSAAWVDEHVQGEPVNAADDVLTPLNRDGTVREFAAHGTRVKTGQGDVGTLVGYDARGYLLVEFFNGFLANNGNERPYTTLTVIPANAQVQA